MSTISKAVNLSDVGDCHGIVKRYQKAFSIKEESPIPSLEEVREQIAAAFPELSTIHPIGVSAERMCGIIKSVFDEGIFHFDALERREKFYLEDREKWDEEDEDGDGEDGDASEDEKPYEFTAYDHWVTTDWCANLTYFSFSLQHALTGFILSTLAQCFHRFIKKHRPKYLKGKGIGSPPSEDIAFWWNLFKKSRASPDNSPDSRTWCGKLSQELTDVEELVKAVAEYITSKHEGEKECEAPHCPIPFHILAPLRGWLGLPPIDISDALPAPQEDAVAASGSSVPLALRQTFPKSKQPIPASYLKDLKFHSVLDERVKLSVASYLKGPESGRLLDEQIEPLQTKIMALGLNMASKIETSALQVQATAFQTQAATFQSETAELKTSMNNLETKLKKSEQKVARLQTLVKTLQNDVRELKPRAHSGYDTQGYEVAGAAAAQYQQPYGNDPGWCTSTDVNEGWR